MKKTIAVVMLPVLILSFTGMISCKNRASRQEREEQKKIELQQVETIETEIEKNVYPLPTSAKVIKMLSELEVGYIIGISNPVENTKKYFSSTRRATNMGVYGADLSYATLYNIQQEVINYLNAIRSLANELNMSKIYDESLYDRIKNNFDDRDTLVAILTEAFNSTYGYLSDNDQQALALLVVGGAWVEGMYLTTHVSEAAYNVAGIAGVLLEQKKSFELYLEITQPYANDPGLSEFINMLDPMKKVYDGLSTSLTNKNIIDITKAIEEIRSKVVI
ncbi:MAG TPA: hypothetical protein VMW32_08415 [Bacteroidales bacterium]|nr:hypothetical protein [Bacteroidales bacterium]